MEEYAQFTTTQIGYRAWFDQLVQTEDILVHPKRAPVVALPQEGLECGPSEFVIPEPSRRRVVNEVIEDVSDAGESAHGDISSDFEIDDPPVVSMLNTPVSSPDNTSVIGDEVNLGVISDLIKYMYALHFHIKIHQSVVLYVKYYKQNN